MAFAVACSDAVCAGAPIYSAAGTPPELKAAIARTFTNEVNYVPPAAVEAMTDDDGLFIDGGTFITTLAPKLLTQEAIGIDVWLARGFNNGIQRTYILRWDGAGWTRATPEEVGVTVTTAVP